MSAASCAFNWASLTGGGAEYAFGTGAKLKLGADISVYAGDEAQPREIFHGTITAVEAEYATGSPPEMTVLAEDALQRARMARRSRIHRDKSPADVARDIATELGLTPVVAGLDAPVGVWAQLNESDLAFLRRLLARFDGDMQIVGSELHVSPRGDVRRGTLELELHGQLARARIRVDLADQATAITTRGGMQPTARRCRSCEPRDSWGQAEDATAPPCFRSCSMHAASISAISRWGPTPRHKPSPRRCSTCGRGGWSRSRASPRSNAQLRVGTHCRITGVDRRFENTYYVVGVCHHTTCATVIAREFRAECACLGDD
jgi:phage protein D